jgi:hypothetical protein
MRASALTLVALAGFGCRRGSLQDDAGGPGAIAFDGGVPGGDAAAGDGPGTNDGPGTSDGPGTADVWLPTADANCGMMGGITSPRLAPEFLVVLDRAVSVDPTRWNGFLSAVAATITANSSTVDWGLYSFPTDGPACSAAIVSVAGFDVPPAPDNATHVVAHIVAAGTGASGTPAAAAIYLAASYMMSRSTTNPKFLLLVTDGSPDCSGSALDTGQAQADAVAAITATKGVGLPTFVLAPSTTTAAGDIAALNALAEAGGYAQPGDIKFFTEATFGNTLEPIEDRSCIVNLGFPRPPVPDIVTVTVNGATVPRDRAHILGWDYTDPNTVALQLYGSWCEMWLHRPSEFHIYYGCPDPG